MSGNRFEPRQSFGGLVVEAGARISRIGRDELRKAGLEHLSFGRIGVLSRLLDGSATQAELCATLGQTPPSMGELLQRLHADGLVASAPDEHDRRKTNFSLTAMGRRDIVKARAVYRKSGKRIDEAFARLSITPREIERLKTILLRFVEATGRDAEEDRARPGEIRPQVGRIAGSASPRALVRRPANMGGPK